MEAFFPLIYKGFCLVICKCKLTLCKIVKGVDKKLNNLRYDYLSYPYFSSVTTYLCNISTTPCCNAKIENYFNPRRLVSKVK